MNEQPEQQPQPVQPPVTELPPVPVVPEALPQQQTSPVEPPQPVAEPVAATEPPALASEPMGRPVELQNGLEWQASEYVEHEKSLKWFIVLGAVTVVLVALAIFLLKNYTFALLLVVMAAAIVVWAKRPAREMYYKLETATIWVNDKPFALHDFRAFGLVQDGAIYTVTLLPNKRFSPGVTVYFPHELGEQIADVLGASLPMEDMEPDWIDKLTHKLNF